MQTGIGRTGAWFAHQRAGVDPDVTTLAKGLGGGLPIGACLAFGEAAQLLAPGQHGSTFGGSALACRVALEFCDILDELLPQIQRVGGYFHVELNELARKHSIVKEVRGAGLMWGIDLTRDAGAVVPAALERGVVVNRTADTVVRLLPPLVITEAEADDALGRLDAALGALGATA